MEIFPLKHKPQYLDQVAEWIYSEWGIKNLGSSISTVRDKLERFKNDDQIPINYVAVEGEILIGTFNLMLSDPPNKKDLSPWFGSLYVAPDYRNLGIGTSLIKFAVSEAKKLGVQKLYLCTPSKQQMYAKLGWKPTDKVEFRGEEVTIMEITT